MASASNTNARPRVSEPIAIIGMSGRHPKARDLEQLWANLRDGRDCISFFSDDELIEAGVDPAMVRQPNYVKARAMLDDIDVFDAAFFGINPREAQVLDPQQRLFLECAYEALEEAGYDPLRMKVHVGVFGGCASNSYEENVLMKHAEYATTIADFQMGLLHGFYLTTRVSFKLDLKGPSVFMYTACSTSLVAVVQACQSLLDRACDMALAGGAAIGVPQKAGHLYHEGEIMSPDGYCRPFDAAAGGTVAGDGVGIVLLKRLADAIRDGDRIRAVILGGALNNDGSEKAGFSAPSIEGQADVIRRALEYAGVGADTIGFVEAHGTATQVGDPIEVAALTRAYRVDTDRRHYCAIGSIKSNMAHLNTAAGSAGLIKAVLALEHAQIPPSLHFERPHPEIDFATSPFFVNTTLLEWRAGATPRRAGVSSFGVGGTNAHVVLEEAPPVTAGGPARAQHLLALSAKTKKALETMTANLAVHMRAHPELELADIAFTTQVSRSGLAHRRAIVCSSTAGALEALEGNAPRRVAVGQAQSGDPPVAFLFPGQGAQHPDMGRELYESEPVFKEHFDACATLLEPELGLDLRVLVYPRPEEADAAADRLAQTSLTQPAIFAVEYALARLWMAWGVRPRAMIGHSVGELVAACLAGVFPLETALRLVAARGKMMQELPPGAMLGVPLPEEEVAPFIVDGLSLAAVNGPSSCVVSGPAESIERLQQRLEAGNLRCRPLHTSHAFHSAMMEPIVAPFAELVRRSKPAPAALRCVSTVTGTWIEPEQWADPDYWARNLRQPVRFSDGVLELLADPALVLLEVGPGQTLSTLVRQHTAEATGRTVLASMRHPQEKQSDLAFLLSTLGRLWIAGVRIDWQGMHAGTRRLRVPLPTYPFQRVRYWVDPPQPGAEAAAETAGVARAAQPLSKNPDLSAWFWAPGWTRTALPQPAPASDGADGCALVLADDEELASALVERLRRTRRVVRVRAAEQFAARGPDDYEMRPGERADYDALLSELRRHGMAPRLIAHLWNVVPPGRAPATLATLGATQERSFYSLLFLAQALGEQFPSAQVEVEIVTNGLFDVIGGEAVHPERASVIGPCRVVPQEHATMRCRTVDLELGASSAAARAAEVLVAEWSSARTDPIVAYRGAHRWIPGFDAARLPPAPATVPRLREGGVYLITGGLGGIGLVVARYLAEKVRAKLVLVGRSGLPPRSKWERWSAEHGEQDRVSRRIREIEALERHGAEVLVASANVADAEQMGQVVARARVRFGAIHGVIHAAGLSTGGMVAARSVAAAAEVLDPKVKGTLILSELLRDDRLDFFLLCSSVAAILGGLGAADYCGANSFLDALAQSSDLGRAHPFVSVNWDSWTEVGMAAETAVPEELRAARARELANGILSVEGQEAFARILCDAPRQVAVVTRDLNAIITAAREWRGLDAPDASDGAAPSGNGQTTEAVAAPKSGLLQRPDLPQEYLAPRTDLERSVAGVVSASLGIDRIGVHDNFFDLGFDSLIAHRMIRLLEKSIAISLPMRALLGVPSVAEVAKLIESQGGASGASAGSAGLPLGRSPGGAPAKAAATEASR